MLNSELGLISSMRLYGNNLRLSTAFKSAVAFFDAIDEEGQKDLAYLIFDDFSILIRKLFPIRTEVVADALAVTVAMELFSMKVVLKNPSSARLFLYDLFVFHINAYLVDARKKREIAEIIKILPILKLFHHEERQFRE